MRRLLELTVNNLFVRLLVTGLIIGIPATITTSWLGARYLSIILHMDFGQTVLALFFSGTIAAFVSGLSMMYSIERWIIRDRAAKSWGWVLIRIILNMLTGIPMSIAIILSISLVMGRDPASIDSIVPVQTILQSGVVGLLYSLIE